MTKKTKPAAAPEAPPIGALIDALYEARRVRLDLEKKVDELKTQEREAKDAVLSRLAELGLQKASGEACTAAIQVKRTVKLLDWPTFWAWARKDKTGNYLQKRVAVEATRELMDSGKPVPGAEIESIVDLSLTKVARA